MKLSDGFVNLGKIKFELFVVAFKKIFLFQNPNKFYSENKHYP